MNRPRYIDNIQFEKDINLSNGSIIHCYRIDNNFEEQILDEWSLHIRRNYISDEALEKSSLEDLLSHFNDYCHRIQILRVVCRDCGRTHAILPSDVIPFHQISMVLMMSLFMMIRLNDKSSEQRIRVPQSARGDEDLYQAVSWQYLHALFQILQQYLPRMIAALRQSLIYTQSVDPRADELLRIYLDGSHPSRAYLAYLRLFRCPLFVSRRNTVTYPLRYIVSGIG